MVREGWQSERFVSYRVKNLRHETYDGTLHGLIIEINALEEEGDRLFIDSMRKLHTEEEDPIQIIAWREIYSYLEKCCDACEHVADIVESVIMKNT